MAEPGFSLSMTFRRRANWTKLTFYHSISLLNPGKMDEVGRRVIEARRFRLGWNSGEFLFWYKKEEWKNIRVLKLNLDIDRIEDFQFPFVLYRAKM